MESLESVFLNSASECGHLVRQWPTSFESHLRRAIKGCSGPPIDTPEAKRILRECWFRPVFSSMDWAAIDHALPIFADELVQHLATTKQGKRQSCDKETTTRPKNFEGLPYKKNNLTQYLDAAKLTERQRDCFSLVFEYGVSKTETAQRLGLHHSTVQEHLNTAEQKIKMAGDKIKRQHSREL